MADLKAPEDWPKRMVLVRIDDVWLHVPVEAAVLDPTVWAEIGARFRYALEKLNRG